MIKRGSVHKRKQTARRGNLLPITVFATLIALAALNVSLLTNDDDHLLELKDIGELQKSNDKRRASNTRLLRLKQPPIIKAIIKRDLVTLRHSFEKICTELGTTKDLEVIELELERQLESFFKPPSTIPKPEVKDPVEPCIFTFIDLGANVGDSLGKFIDAGFPFDCPGLERVRSRVQYNIGHGAVHLGDGNVTELTDYVRELLDEHSRNPEDYCYVGVEGNPVFTPTLKELEARVKGTIPTPIHAVHFYTETVAAGKDGPTVLFLDTVNEAQNFWGSSMVRTHVDVEKSAEENGDSPVEAKVMGLSLSTLLKRSVKRQRGAHVIMKIDIEGAEYPVMNAAIDTLCDFKSAGVQVDLILETHSDDVLGAPSQDLVQFETVTKRRMKACGIRSGLLSPKLGQ